MPRPNSQNRNASSRRLAGQQIVAALKKRWAAKRAAAAEPEKPAVDEEDRPEEGGSAGGGESLPPKKVAKKAPAKMAAPTKATEGQNRETRESSNVVRQHEKLTGKHRPGVEDRTSSKRCRVAS